jgi:hypothetical protein
MPLSLESDPFRGVYKDATHGPDQFRVIFSNVTHRSADRVPAKGCFPLVAPTVELRRRFQPRATRPSASLER